MTDGDAQERRFVEAVDGIRMTMLTTSAAPRTLSATSDSTKSVDRANTTVAAPKTITARNSVRPSRCSSG